MISKRVWPSLVLLVIVVGSVGAGEPEGDPLRALLIPPDVILRNAARLGLTENQQREFGKRVEETARHSKGQHENLRKAMGELARLLSEEKIEEEAALKQLDKVLGIEKELKQRHARLMIYLRNSLTQEQRRLVAKLQQTDQKPTESPEVTRKRLQQKLERIQKAIQRRVQDGKPPLDIVAAMQKFPELMQKGQVREAEALLDRMLDQLGGKEPKPDVKPLPKKLLPPKGEPLSLGEVEKEVATLKKENVEWRKIPWKTCLLDGLKASREENKPIVLWIFIDRPIDDERC